MNIKLKFLGAAGSVTGSKTLLNVDKSNYLIDCGLFQGLKKLRLQNWRDFPIDPSLIKKILLTHAHIDHSGHLPTLVKQGYTGKILSTHSTKALCNLLLPDAGYLQEEDARFANQHGFSKHSPALPLFTVEDAHKALKQFESIEWNESVNLEENISAQWREAGHILGAATIQINVSGTRITFSGDLGRSNCPVMRPPTPIKETDYLILESTYGDRTHPEENTSESLEKIINKTIQRGGITLVPSFAVGRTQQILYYVHQLQLQRRIPNDIPVYVNSPMATEATRIYTDYNNDQALTLKDCQEMLKNVHFISSPQQSRALNGQSEPAIIIAASGMASGGRVLHHLKAFAPDKKNTILFVGFQAPGTRGEKMLSRSTDIKIHGEVIPVRAEVTKIDTLSAHADQNEMIAWLKNFQRPPKCVFLNHGEDAARTAFKKRIEEELHWRVALPSDLETIELQ